MKNNLIKSPLLAPFVAVIISFTLCCVFLASIGENPWVLFESLKSTLFTGFGLGYALFYTTPLIFTGLSVAISFQCGLFNIGSEGQLYVGSIFLIAFVHFFPNLPVSLALTGALFASLIGGAIWGGLAGVLKAKRGSHEVIVTILLNFIGIAFVDYLILYPFKDLASPNPETFMIPPQYTIPLLSDLFARWGIDAFKTTPVNISLFLAIAVAIIAYFVLRKTTLGFELRAVGKSPRAAEFAGISVSKNIMLALAISGALAGLVAVNEVQGFQHRLVQGFSPSYGFTGIAVSLLARNHPLGILASAFLFGTLTNSTRELEFLSDKVSKELSFVLQGTLIALISADHLFNHWLTRLRLKRRLP
jgi:ABC-type uncharacterized transport system permease subunit